MTDLSGVNVQRTSQTQQSSGVGTIAPTGQLGEHTVELGEGQNARAQGTSFGDKVKAFFGAIRDAFVSLGNKFSQLGEKIGNAIERAKQERAQGRVDGWENSGVDLNAQNRTKPLKGSQYVDKAIGQILDVKTHLGSAGMHAMAKEMIDSFKTVAAERGPPTTWQDVARDGIKLELLRAPNYEAANKLIGDFEKHFSTYAKAGQPADLVEFGNIVSGLRTEVTDPARVETMARTAFDQEIDDQLSHPDTFFRGTSEFSVASATLLRNANSGTTGAMLEALSDVLTSTSNREDVELLNSARNGEYTKEQFGALERLTRQFMEKAFGLEKDGGQGFVDRFDPTAKSFLSHITGVVAGKGDVSVDGRNEAIRTLFANGMALRDFGGPAAVLGRDLGCPKAAIEVATNLLRVLGNVQSVAVGGKLSESVVSDYDAFIKDVGPKFQQLLTSLGMPTVA